MFPSLARFLRTLLAQLSPKTDTWSMTIFPFPKRELVTITSDQVHNVQQTAIPCMKLYGPAYFPNFWILEVVRYNKVGCTHDNHIIQRKIQKKCYDKITNHYCFFSHIAKSRPYTHCNAMYSQDHVISYYIPCYRSLGHNLHVPS